MNSNIIDAPRLAGAQDLLGVDKYMEALIQFIGDAELPTTIAIQGEWGSGKTSMMNQIRFQLANSSTDNNYPFYGVWLNTWQYALMKEPSEVLSSIIIGITKEIMTLVASKHNTKTEQLTRRVGSILGKVVKSAAKTAISSTGLDGNIVDELLSSESNDASILDLKNALQDSIQKCLDEDKKVGDSKRGFVFFIDDLDRIDPPMAVEILEIIKNIFEVENCIFILAIDYEVVVKGLEPKFGPLTSKNEREFRSFFDKIIQLPFSMPISNYQIDNLLIDSLFKVNYITENLLKDDDFKSTITEMATQSVGTNPRAIKRLTNTLSLIQIINDLDENELGKSRADKLLNFGLVCIQIAYPSLYHLIVQEPDYINWNDKIANKLQLKKLTEDQIERLNDTEEFDEDWEKIVFRVCMVDPFLNRNIYNVSNLLNNIKGLIPENKQNDFGTEIQNILSLSAVTDVSTDQIKPKKSSNKDFSKYVYNGKTLGKGKLALAIVKEYADSQPGITFDKLKIIFPDDMIGGKSGVFVRDDEAKSIFENGNVKRHFLNDNELISLQDCKVAVSSQWGSHNINSILNKAKELNFNITGS